MSLIGKDELCELIPHSGTMCLLDEVIDWDESNIKCSSSSHLQKSNPLRSKQGLNSIMLIEYGAQAMAIHGGLLARKQQMKIGEGYLAGLRGITIKDQSLDGIKEPLVIEASKLMAQDGNMIYEFSIKSDSELLASGRATVIARN